MGVCLQKLAIAAAFLLGYFIAHFLEQKKVTKKKESKTFKLAAAQTQNRQVYKLLSLLLHLLGVGGEHSLVDKNPLHARALTFYIWQLLTVTG